jgi:hypothetical protein
VIHSWNYRCGSLHLANSDILSVKDELVIILGGLVPTTPMGASQGVESPYQWVVTNSVGIHHFLQRR